MDEAWVSELQTLPWFPNKNIIKSWKYQNLKNDLNNLDRLWCLEKYFHDLEWILIILEKNSNSRMTLKVWIWNMELESNHQSLSFPISGNTYHCVIIQNKTRNLLNVKILFEQHNQNCVRQAIVWKKRKNRILCSELRH